MENIRVSVGQFVYFAIGRYSKIFTFRILIFTLARNNCVSNWATRNLSNRRWKIVDLFAWCELAWYFLDNRPEAHYQTRYNRELFDWTVYNDSGTSAADAIVNVNRSRWGVFMHGSATSDYVYNEHNWCSPAWLAECALICLPIARRQYYHGAKAQMRIFGAKAMSSIRFARIHSISPVTLKPTMRTTRLPCSTIR